MHCPNCQQDNPADARFCNACGAAIPASTEVISQTGPSSFSDDRYRVEGILGEGGKGVVYLCQDTILGRRVAIKLIKQEVMDPDSLARFQREVQSMAQLVHTNVVTIFDVGQEDGRHYLVLELMEGGSVENLIAAGTAQNLDIDATLRIGQEVTRGLAHAHSNGILHRDIKPGNIWLTAEGLAKLGDFGLAYLGAETRVTPASMMVGTVAYMAPEIALGRPADERSDLYMLGASLYEMATGRLPFPGEDPVRVIFSHVNDLPLGPKRLAPELPTALETLILRLLAKDPEQRPNSAHDVLGTLEQIQSRLGDGSEIVQTNVYGTGATDDFHRPPNLTRTTTPEPRWIQGLVGRDQERETLRARLDAAMQGEGGLVFITGEAGIGKTRLAADLRAYARGRGCQWLEGRYEKEGSIPLQPYVEAVRAYLRTATQGAVVDAVGPYATELGIAFPEIAQRLGTTLPAPDLADLDPETSRQRQIEARCHLFFTIASQAPLVLFLDDLQWAPSMEALRPLAQQATGHPLLLVGAYREREVVENTALSRFVLSMNRDRLFIPVALRRLNRDQVGQMVTQALGQTSSQLLLDLIFQRTEGNPFFVEESVRYLVENGALTLEDQVWDLRETGSLQMPESVKLIVEERLERLDQETRQTLAIASVIGQEFDLALLQEVTDTHEESLVDAVDQAVEARLLVPRSVVGQEAYAFADNQVREALYESTGIARRRRYHLQVGEAIEKLYERRLEEHFDALAYHFLEGNNLEKTAGYSIKAGDLAYAQSVFPRARNHYLTAAVVLEELGEESERGAHVQAQLGTRLITGVISGQSGSEGTGNDIEQLLRAIEIFERLGNSRRAAMLHRSLGAAYLSGSGVGVDYTEAMRHYESAVDLMASQEDSVEKSIAYDGLAWGYLSGLQLELGEQMAWEALRIAQSIGDPDAMTQSCTELGIALTFQGRLSAGLPYLESAWTSSHQAHTPWFRERAAAFATQNVPWMGELDHYQKWFARWEELHRQLGTRRYEPNTASTMSAILAQAGNPEGARVLLTRLRESGSIPPLRMYAVAQTILGERDEAFEALAALWKRPVLEPRVAVHLAPYYGRLLLDMGQPREGEELLRTQWERCHAVGALTFELNLLPPLIESYLELNRLEEARTFLQRAEEILAMPEDWKGLAAGVFLAEGLLAAAEARWEEADASFQQAVDINEQHGLMYDQARSLYSWAVAYLERDGAQDGMRGLELLDQSLAFFQQCDAKKDIEMVLERKSRAQGIDFSGVRTSIDAVASAISIEQPDLRSHTAPDGTVTILFSDIEGSTQMTERLGDQRMQQILRSHNDIIRHQLAAYGGFEVKSLGDGFMLAFSSARRATQCATAIQRAFAAHNREHPQEPMLLRMGLHTGELIQEKEDFFGKNVILASRIADQAQGGEILVSSLLKELTESAGDIEFGKEREVELKGLAGLNKVYQVDWT